MITFIRGWVVEDPELMSNTNIFIYFPTGCNITVFISFNLFHYTILTIMGGQHSQLTTIALNDHYSKANTIQTQYYHRVFTSHKISSLQFKEKLRSIRKRSTYLQYGWARELQDFIKVSNKDKLYKEYKSTLKENCIRQGRKEKLFCPKNFRNSFLRELAQKTQKCSKTITFENLESLIEQCKAFLMVTCWLHQLVTLQKDAENQSQNQVKKVSFCCQNKEIYEILLDLAQKYYRQQLKFERAQPVVKITDMDVKESIGLLQKTRKFNQRELIIAHLIKLLQADKENSLQNFIGVCQTLGKSNIAAHLLIMRQLGAYQVPKAEKYLRLCTREYFSQNNADSSPHLN